MKAKLKKYSFLILVLIVNILVLFLFPHIGRNAFSFTGKNILHFLFVLTPVFVCVGLLDVWVDRKKMIKIMGETSGLKGIIIAFLLGVVTAVPLYALLPVAGMMLKKGSKISNVLIFICACASIRIPLLLFEVSSMGWRFTVTRFLVNIFIVLIIAFIIDRLLSEADKKEIYAQADRL